MKGRLEQIAGEVVLAHLQAPAGPLESDLVRFAGVLRRLGVPVGSGEVLDAADALLLVNLLDRGQVKTALAATLAKDERSKEILGQAFDLYFVSPERRSAALEMQAAQEDARAERVQMGSDELRFQGSPLELSDAQKEAYALLSAAQRERLREFLAQSSEGHGVDSSFTPLIENIVRGHLDRWRRQADGAERARHRGEDGQEGRAVPDGAGAGAGGGAGTGQDNDPLLYLDMKEIGETDVARVRVLIRRLAKRLATRIIRRYRISRQRQRVDFRRTVRANVRYGGTPVELHYKSRRVHKPKIVLICDVSGSMAKYASFILQFTHGLAKAVRDIEVFLFAEDLEHVTPALRQDRDLTGTAAGLVDRSAVWGKGTNLAAALHRLLDEHRAKLTPDALLLMVSDSKTVAVGDATSLLADISRRVRGIIWLNPIPAANWDGLPATAAFARYAAMYECSTLSDLERVLRQTIAV